jgi:hypothetical protein
VEILIKNLYYITCLVIFIFLNFFLVIFHNLKLGEFVQTRNYKGHAKVDKKMKR